MYKIKCVWKKKHWLILVGSQSQRGSSVSCMTHTTFHLLHTLDILKILRRITHEWIKLFLSYKPAEVRWYGSDERKFDPFWIHFRIYFLRNDRLTHRKGYALNWLDWWTIFFFDMNMPGNDYSSVHSHLFCHTSSNLIKLSLAGGNKVPYL